MSKQITIRGNSSRGNSSKENENKEVQDEGMEDQITIREWLSAKRNYVETKTLAETEAVAAIVSEDDRICFTLAVDVPPSSVGDSRNMPIVIDDEEDVLPIESETKQDAALTRNEISIGETKGVVKDGVKSKPVLNDGAEGSNTVDVSTLGLDHEVLIRRLEKGVSKLKEKRFGENLKNHFAGSSSGP